MNTSKTELTGSRQERQFAEVVDIIAQYKRILIPQERMQEQLNDFCQFFLTEKKGDK